MTTSTITTSPPRTGRARRLWTIAVAALAALAVLAAVAALAVRAQLDLGEAVLGVAEVAVRDSEFAPAAVQVPGGTTLTWHWEGEEAHNVVGDGFASVNMVEGTFSHAFADPGTYAYRCTLHFFMRGEVVVTD